MRLWVSVKKIVEIREGSGEHFDEKTYPPLPALLYRYIDGVPTERLKAFTMRLYQRFASVWLKLLVTSYNIHYVNSLSLE